MNIKALISANVRNAIQQPDKRFETRMQHSGITFRVSVKLTDGVRPAFTIDKLMGHIGQVLRRSNLNDNTGSSVIVEVGDKLLRVIINIDTNNNTGYQYE